MVFLAIVLVSGHNKMMCSYYWGSVPSMSGTLKCVGARQGQQRI